MSQLRELLERDTFRYALVAPPVWNEHSREYALIQLPEAFLTEASGAYLVVSALRSISTWNGSDVCVPSTKTGWGFTMAQAIEALKNIGMSEDDATWFLMMLHVKVPMVPIYFENEKPPAG